MDIQAEIEQQTQRVHAAYEAWDRADAEVEQAAWKLYRAEHDKLDALIVYAKAAEREKVTA